MKIFLLAIFLGSLIPNLCFADGEIEAGISAFIIFIALLPLVFLITAVVYRIQQKRHPLLIKCPNCKYEGAGKTGRSWGIIYLLLLFTGFLLWIPLIAYIAATKNWICPKCDFKNIVKSPPKTSSPPQ